MANFLIDYDHLDGQPHYHVIGEWPTKACKDAINGVFPFRLYDDDGELYFSGYSDTPFSQMDSDTAFLPLDQFGAAYGCTYMCVLEAAVWEQL